MSEALPSEIEVNELAGGAYYRLPRRQLGGFRWLGVFLVLFGLFFAGAAIAWKVFMVGIFWGGGNNAFDWIGILFALLGIPFVLAGLAVVGAGLAILIGRSEIEVQDGRLRGIERVGPFHYSWKRPIDQIRQLVVSASNARVNGKRVTSGSLAEMSAIKVECKEAGPILLAPGYPRSWLGPLANDLSRRCSLQEPTAASEPAAAVPVVEEEPEEESARFIEREEQPVDSLVTLEQDATGVTLTVPPAGVWRGSSGFFVFGLIWCGIIGGISLIYLFAGAAKEGGWVLVLVLGLFWLTGFGLLLGGLNMGKRRAVLAVVSNRLLILQTGIFGSKRREWSKEELSHVDVGPSGIEVNDVPVLELQVFPKEGSKLGLLAGRGNDELYWLATMLRKALKLQPPAEENPANRTDPANVQDDT